MKVSRQSLILEIIENENIYNQAQLQEALEARGIKTTQATLSRDIRALNLQKDKSSGGIGKYIVAPKAASDENNRLNEIFRRCVVKVDVAMNLVVIHTMPGLANAAAAALDSMNLDYLVGSLAGDDTAFIAMKSIEEAESLCNLIQEKI